MSEGRNGRRIKQGEPLFSKEIIIAVESDAETFATILRRNRVKFTKNKCSDGCKFIIPLDLIALGSENVGAITRTGNSFTAVIPAHLMEHKGGFVSKLGYLASIPFVDLTTGEKGFMNIHFKLPKSLEK